MQIHLLLGNLLVFIYSSIKVWLRDGLLDIIATGPVPRHISFEMDGNRRYAKRLGKEGKEGHPIGIENMFRVLERCGRLRIQCVTVYMCAIDNLNRSKDEVGTLMELFIKVAQRDDFFIRHGIRPNFLGRRELLPLSVQEAISRAERITRPNDTMIVNFCAPYASQDEITTAVESVIQKAADAGDTSGSTITEDSIQSYLSTSLAGSPPLDIFVRTSGVKRLSGFLTWQCCENTQIHVVDTLWPEFGLFDLVPILLEYQRKVWQEQRYPNNLSSIERTCGTDPAVKVFGRHEQADTTGG